MFQRTGPDLTTRPSIRIYWLSEEDGKKFRGVRIPEGDVTWTKLETIATLTGRTRKSRYVRAELTEVDIGDCKIWLRTVDLKKFDLEDADAA